MLLVLAADWSAQPDPQCHACLPNKDRHGADPISRVSDVCGAASSFGLASAGDPGRGPADLVGRAQALLWSSRRE